MRIKYFLGSSNSEEYGEVTINVTYVRAQAQINVQRQSYNSHLLEVRLVAAGDGQPYDVFFQIRSDQFAPNIVWNAFDVKANGFVVYNDTTSPGAASASLVLSSGAASNITSTNSVIQAFGGGVQFPVTQVASANANTLDDYEEGTWTPTDASGAVLTFTSVGGEYTKIGRQVIAYFMVTFPSTASSGQITIGGLPYNSASSSNVANPGSGGFTYQTASISNVTMAIGAGGAQFNFWTLAGAAVANSSASTFTIRGWFQYFTNT
jgi:hypothetical protein